MDALAEGQVAGGRGPLGVKSARDHDHGRQCAEHQPERGHVPLVVLHDPSVVAYGAAEQGRAARSQRATLPPPDCRGSRRGFDLNRGGRSMALELEVAPFWGGGAVTHG